MIIQGNGYKMEKLADAKFFNLSIVTTVNKGKDSERSDYKIIGYGIPFDICIKYVVDYRMRELEGEISVREYVEKFKDFVDIMDEDFE